MADNGVELRKIAWSQAFPFVRLFQSLRLALDFKRLMLALAGIVLVYLGGRILDVIWVRAGHGVLVAESGGRLQTEVDAYTRLPGGQFAEWHRAAADARREARVRAVTQAGRAADATEAERKLADHTVRDLVVDARHKEALADARRLIADRVKAGLDALERNRDLTKAAKAERRSALIAAADRLRLLLDDSRRDWSGPLPDVGAAINTLLTADAGVEAAQLAKDRKELQSISATQLALAQAERLEPRGPFRTLLNFESRCFAAAIEGVCAGRWGFAEGALDTRPAMVSSMASGVRGLVWFVTRFFWFAVLFTLLALVVFSYFGGAVCRSAAVQSARDESITLREALRFARDKYSGFLLAPLMPAGFFIGIAVLIFVGGLVGAIPYVGEILAGLFYPLTLLGGFALALIVLAVVLGFHLMWPTIAVEGSDGFDALSRACSYVGSRIWHYGLYSGVLLLYGGISFVLVRIVAMLTLKLAHTTTKLGMNLASGSGVDGLGKLDAIWQMPAWSDLSLLPSAGDVPFWGTFHNAPLNGTEMFALFFFRLWVYLLVGVVAAFALCFFFCGSTQMYYLLRREVDATDWEEVYYEEPGEELPPAPQPAAGATTAPAPGAGEAAPATGAPAESSPPPSTPPATPPADQPPPA